MIMIAATTYKNLDDSYQLSIYFSVKQSYAIMISDWCVVVIIICSLHVPVIHEIRDIYIKKLHQFHSHNGTSGFLQTGNEECPGYPVRALVVITHSSNKPISTEINVSCCARYCLLDVVHWNVI